MNMAGKWCNSRSPEQETLRQSEQKSNCCDCRAAFAASTPCCSAAVTTCKAQPWPTGGAPAQVVSWEVSPAEAQRHLEELHCRWYAAALVEVRSVSQYPNVAVLVTVPSPVSFSSATLCCIRQVRICSTPAEGIAGSHQTNQTGQRSLNPSSAQQPQSSPNAQQRSVTAVLVRCRDDDVHPDPHGHSVGGHQEEEAIVCLDAEGQTGPRRLRRENAEKEKWDWSWLTKSGEEERLFIDETLRWTHTVEVCY